MKTTLVVFATVIMCAVGTVSASASSGGRIVTSSTAYGSLTTYSPNCPPPPGVFIPAIHIDAANTILSYDYYVTDCAGTVWYHVPGTPDSWYVPAYFVVRILPPTWPL